ncbi:MAG: His/Gly/Thr/Pro-type tRNA ligase C-terminal domain-containing protein, partial [Phycisphaerales bacterium]
VRIAAKLRQAGKKTDFSYKGGGLGKQLKQASQLGAEKCVIVGQEFVLKRELVIKDMTSGQQMVVSEKDLNASSC